MARSRIALSGPWEKCHLRTFIHLWSKQSWNISFLQGLVLGVGVRMNKRSSLHCKSSPPSGGNWGIKLINEHFNGRFYGWLVTISPGSKMRKQVTFLIKKAGSMTSEPLRWWTRGTPRNQAQIFHGSTEISPGPQAQSKTQKLTTTTKKAKQSPQPPKQTKSTNWNHGQKLWLMEDEDTQYHADSTICRFLPLDTRHVSSCWQENRVCTDIKIQTIGRKHFCGTKIKGIWLTEQFLICF